MPDCFCARGASAKSSSARPVTAANSTAGRSVAASTEANHCAGPGGAISNRDAAGTITPSVSGAIATGAAKAHVERK